MDELLTTGDIAAERGVTLQAVHAYIKLHKVPYLRKGFLRLFRREDVLQYLTPKRAAEVSQAKTAPPNPSPLS